MEVKAESVSAIRGYAFDYIAGILWIAAALVNYISDERLVLLAATMQAVAESAPSIKLPDFVVGFLLTIAGVVLPYSVSVVLKPATLRLMSLLQKGHWKLRGWWRSKWKRHEKRAPAPTLETLVHQRLERLFGCHSSEVFREMKVTYVHMRAKEVASVLSAAEDVVFFRATVVLPSAMLIGACVHRWFLPGNLFLTWSSVLGMILFGSYLANREFDSWMHTIHTAILLSVERDELPPEGTA